MPKYCVTVVENRSIDILVDAPDEATAHVAAWDIAFDLPEWDDSSCYGSVEEIDSFPRGKQVLKAE